MTAFWHWLAMHWVLSGLGGIVTALCMVFVGDRLKSYFEYDG